MNSFSQLSNNNQQYALNDPRNPDCPCHKYQKMADEEYKRIQNQTNLNELQQENTHNQNQEKVEEPEHLQAENDVSNAGSAGNGSADREKFYKRREFLAGISKKINRTKLKYTRIKKIRINSSSCYHWT